jgi:hypothetical protein
MTEHIFPPRSSGDRQLGTSRKQTRRGAPSRVTAQRALAQRAKLERETERWMRVGRQQGQEQVRQGRNGQSERREEQRAIARWAEQGRETVTQGERPHQHAQATVQQPRQPGRSVRHNARPQTIESLLEAYLHDQIGGNRSPKTIEWHRIALGFLNDFFQEQRGISEIEAVEAEDISAWFAHLRTTPGAHGKPRTERTVQTYARSARAFFH